MRFFVSEDVVSMPGISLTLKLQTTKPPGTIQTRKTVDLGIAPPEFAISKLLVAPKIKKDIYGKPKKPKIFNKTLN